jgi:hypothetical protein
MNLQNLNLVELNAQEVKEVDGGFIPLLIWGIAISAETVATAFWVGVGVGAAVAQGQK